jgi:Fe-Mn family superoxide dismutase
MKTHYPIISRRNFLKNTLASSALISASSVPFAFAGNFALRNSDIPLPKLPYPENALEPHISQNTIGYHYGKHHSGYVAKANKSVIGTPFAQLSLKKIIKDTSGKSEYNNIFNNVAQVWNHTFYWHSMRPKGGGEPGGSLAKRIKKEFGSYQNFREEFVQKATTIFGSGWAWLVVDNGDLKIVQTVNADTPLTQGQHPLITLDVWEHAYYLDYQNSRKEYVRVYLEHLVNWDFASSNLEKI